MYFDELTPNKTKTENIKHSEQNIKIEIT